MTATRELTMTISLNALEHLGINLYSNIPAVLSEIVANAWDADAQTVHIDIDRDLATITIQDDGVGMDRDAVIDRFLTVGFKRRDALGPITKMGRKPMGRKGIGKLSIFSVALKAEVYTISGDARTAFRMDREAIRKAISGNIGSTYKPEEIHAWPTELKKGTRIVLSDLSKSLSVMTAEGLKKRVARRFSIIGSKFKFKVIIDKNQITPADRGYHNAIEYIWTYGDQQSIVKACKHLGRDSQSRTGIVSASLTSTGITITGWIGTVSQPSQLKDEEGDNLNRVAIFMRGKLAQEDLLDEFAQKELYAAYVIGELHCDELDLDDQGDIATSSRQAIKLDDPRFESLRSIVLSELRYIASCWSGWRTSDGAKVAAAVPGISDWLDALKGDTKKKAERWIGRLNTIRSQDESDKKELLKASILAFESYRRQEELDKLEEIKNESLDQVLTIFRSIDDLEISYYGQIVRGRVQVINTLQNKLRSNDKELVLRNYIFDHLWLLDPSWERAKGTEHAETSVKNFLEQDTANLPAAEKAGRIDIGYRTTSGKHVIIELKRASVATPLDDLIKQIRKYRDGTRRILETTDYSDWPIEIVCLLGKPPPEWGDSVGTGQKGVIEGLRTVDARIVFYDQLLNSAQRAYADYLVEHDKSDKLSALFKEIDSFVPKTRQ